MNDHYGFDLGWSWFMMFLPVKMMVNKGKISQRLVGRISTRKH